MRNIFRITRSDTAKIFNFPDIDEWFVGSHDLSFVAKIKLEIIL